MFTTSVKESARGEKWQLESEGMVVARCVIFYQDNGGLWLNEMYVHPRYRRRGLATRLFREMEEDHFGADIELLACPIADQGVHISALVSMYQDWGFDVVEDGAYGVTMTKVCGYM